MSDDLRRPCPRCEQITAAERLENDDGITWLWRCTCGWAAARTGGDPVSSARPASGVRSRREVSAEIVQAFAEQRKKRS